jgi:phosphoglucosamine mutase
MPGVKRLFGTDGVRGVANVDLTPDLALALGRAAGFVLASGGGEVVMGRDTRVSGPMLEGGLVAGLCSAGVHVVLAGIIPTPGVAYLTVEEKARAGAVISASHNPVDDNGIKFFSDEGLKVSGEVEEAIEKALEQPIERLPTGVDVGRSEELADAAGRYGNHLLRTIDADLKGLRVVLDCAYGATYAVAPSVFREAGADVIVINAEPDGTRINVDCGSTNLGPLTQKVTEVGADLGLAFDGDGDRMLAVDERGGEVDGDRILALNAIRLHDEGALKNDVVVVTVMANLGFRRALIERGIEIVTSPVGDKFVAEAMADTGAVLGGEQSGHVIFAQHSTTGDGILTGLQVCATLAASDAPLSALAHVFEPFPQVLINVPVRSRDELEGAEELWAEVKAVEESLGEHGRVLLRASGTEPLVRVMVEDEDEKVARSTAESLADSVKRLLG